MQPPVMAVSSTRHRLPKVKAKHSRQPKSELFPGEFALAKRAGLGVQYMRSIMRHGRATVWAAEKLAALTGEPEERFYFGPMWGDATAHTPAKQTLQAKRVKPVAARQLRQAQK